jgi:hypothetical protein
MVFATSLTSAPPALTPPTVAEFLAMVAAEGELGGVQ